MNLHGVLNKGQGRRLLAAGTVTALGLALSGAIVTTAQAAPAPGMKVTVCHRTGSEDGGNQHNGYSEITVNINSVYAAKKLNGHAKHEQVGNGPDGDIIPAYTYTYTSKKGTKTYSYAGKNLGNGGQAFLDAGCKTPPPPPLAELTLAKVVDNTGGGTEAATAWTLDAAGPSSFAEGPTGTSHAVKAGTYTLSESGPAGYTASAWDCPGATMPDDTSVTVGTSDVTCTITNTFVTTPAPENAAITLVKTAVLNDLTRATDTPLKADAGETITYSFLVTNTGNVTLTDVTVVDTFLGSSAVTCDPTTLEPGDSVTCTAAAYSVLDTDVEDGLAIENVATASGQPPTGGRVSDTDDASIPSQIPDVAGVVEGPAISLEKTAVLNDLARASDTPLKADAGETITYSFLVTNTGNVTLTDVTVVDTFLGSSAVTCDPTTLEPGDSVTCTAAAYSVLDTDVEDGLAIENVATASGQPPTGGRVSDTDDASIPSQTPTVLGIVEDAPPTSPPAPVAGPRVGTLAFTGAETVPLGLSGLIVLLLGTVMTLAGRRQGRHRARE